MNRWPAREMQNVDDKVECKNNDMFHHLPLPPSPPRPELRRGFIGNRRCFNRHQHFLRVLLRDQRRSFVRCGLRLFRRHDLSEHNQWLGTSRARRSTLATENQRFVKALWPTATRIFHGVFIVEKIWDVYIIFLANGSTPRETH